MTRPIIQKALTLGAVFFALWLGLRYLLPVALPFLLGLGLALAAEPLVSFFSTRLRLRRGLAAGIGVTIALGMAALALLVLGALAVKEITGLSRILPQAQQTVQMGLMSLQDLLLSLASRMPEGISAFLTDGVLELFSGGTALLSRVSDKLLGLATGLLGRIPDGALGLGTALISGYMFSAKLPKIKAALRQRIPQGWKDRYLPALAAAKASAGAYLLAQCKLAGITFAILTGGLLILGTRLAPLWAGLIALVDAVPLLGTGAVMIPWAMVCLIRGDHIRALGLAAIYTAAAVTRSVLEPRLVGRHMGIDPLVTLFSLYLGYRLWGVMGLLLAPMAAATAVRMLNYE